jgi:hypothetical protein
MRKIIASLMALTITSTAAANVVSCGNQPPRPVPAKYGNNIKFGDYNDGDMFNAYNGTNQTPYGKFQSLNGLLFQTLYLFSFSSSMITNPNKVLDWKEKFIGNDNKNGDAYYAPSVDGIYLKGGPNNETKVEGVTSEEFYKNYETTHINSLAGLYQMYDLVKKGVIAESNLGTAANESYQIIKNAMITNPDTYNFLDSFLNLHGQSWDSSWIEQTISADKQYAELDSKILSYNIAESGEGDNKTTTYQFSPPTPDSPLQELGTVQDYLHINSKVNDEEGHNDEKIGNQYKDPFHLLMLPTNTNIGGNQATFDTTWQHPGSDHSEEVNGSKNWDIRTPQDGWAIKADPAYKKDDKDTNTGYIKTNDSIIVPLEPIKINYLYSTNARDSQATKYEVAITLNNLQAVFTPTIVTSSPNDADKDKTGNRYVKWQFTHYQFTNTVDTIFTPKDKAKGPKNGAYSNMYISNLSVIEVPK